ncbi:MAG: crossover junction endodeoxyribonuclease RuvC [Alphaproteobacteria bacterium]|nr:crossover junction endodeoxyribonuclease RuvC [Alphaproteobacteria bacterium]
MTRILGIDPGLVTTGYGIIDHVQNKITPVTYGLIQPNAQGSMAERLYTLHARLLSVIEEFNPHVAAIEETFVNKNPTSALKLGMARGVLLMTPALKKIPVYEYGANKIKKTIVGVGHANKDQVIMMVKHLLPKVGSDLKADSADALAVALCHAQHEFILGC